ncbi:MAG: hypothetical protein AB7K08_14675 [Microbacteriaceae bacterium]
MTAQTEMTRTDASAGMSRWLTLTIASIATVIGIGVLWALAPAGGDCYVAYDINPGILPGPQPCADGGEGAALTTAGILIALLAAMFVVAFTLVKRRRLVTLIIGGVMLLVLLVGLLVTVTAANQPVLYY